MKWISIVLFLFAQTSFASLPENNLKIPVNSSFANSMTEEKFNAIADRVEDFYTPIVKAQKSVLVISKNWASETVNASAIRFGGTSWLVNLYGGLARHPLVTDDGFMLVICHEMGHHLGGAPTVGGIRGFWAAVEGQADYFATMKCMKSLLKNDDNISITETMDIDPYLKKTCLEKNKNQNEIALCERIGMASLSVGKLLSSLKDNAVINFETPDKSIVKKTEKTHPKAQCRLDTYLAGLVCDNEEVMNRKDPLAGACLKRDGYTEGLRPLCWYKPERKE